MQIKLLTRTSPPWIFRNTPTMKEWIWDTPHFRAIINSDISDKGVQKPFLWSVDYKDEGNILLPLSSDIAHSFSRAEDNVAELVAKSFPRNLGYIEYAGNLAYTFQLGTGDRIDLTSLLGENVIITTRDEQGEEGTFYGIFDIQNYDIIISSSDGSAYRIPPGYIISIYNEYNSQDLITPIKEMQSKIKGKQARIIEGEWVPGCTGRPGFRNNTVEHSIGDPYCPVHNI